MFSIVHLFPLKNRNKQVKIFLFFIRSVSDVFDTKHEVPFSNFFFLLMITQKALHCLMRVKPQALVYISEIGFSIATGWTQKCLAAIGGNTLHPGVLCPLFVLLQCCPPLQDILKEHCKLVIIIQVCILVF